MTQADSAPSRRPGTVVWLVAAYFVLAVILRLLRSDALQSDEAEQAFQSQFLLLGYGDQPPLYNWLQYGVVELFGLSLAALSILKNALLFLCCLFYGLAARLVVRDERLAALAMAGVLTLPPVSIMAQRDLTHAVATLFAVSLFLYGFLLALTRPSLGAYLLTGIAAGTGMLAKYNFVLVPFAAVLAVLADAQWRKRLLDPRMIWALLAAGLLCLPHYLWALDHLATATGDTVKAMREDSSGHALGDAAQGLFTLAASTLAGIAGPLLFFGIAFGRDAGRAWRAKSRESRLIGRMLLICLVSVALIALALGASSIKQKWLSPFLLLVPLFLSLKLDAAGADTSRGLRRFLPPLAVAAVGFLVYLAVANAVGPLVGKYGKENAPYGRFFETVLADRGEPGLVLAQGQYLAGNARLHLPETPAATPEFPARPALSIAGQERPALLVWHEKEEGAAVPESLAALAREFGIDTEGRQPQRLAVPYGDVPDGPEMVFGYLWSDIRR